MQPAQQGLHILQKISMSLMGVLVLLTFIGTNLQAVFWQTSDWLVSTVLPATVVDLTNKERAQNAAAPLQRSLILDSAAKLKAEHMAKNQYFAHFSPTGVSPWHWFDQAGYVYAHAGENLAIHFTDSSEVVEAWMKSLTHRQNIVNGLYTEIGVGTAKGKFDGYDTVYVVQLFGTPATAPLPVSKPAPTAVAAVSPAPTTEVTLLPDEEEEEATVEVLSAQDGFTELEITVVEEKEVSELESEVLITSNEPVEALVPEPVPPIPPSESLLTITEPAEVSLVADDVVVIETSMISTSSGLAIANITTPNYNHAGGTAASIATQPNALLQMIYLILGAIVFLLLSTSIIVEARRLHYMQVAYGVMLLIGMGGLWFINSLLTAGAVIA